MNKIKFISLIVIAIIAISVIFNKDVSANNAHRFHSSLTRIDYDSKEKNIKIVIQLITHDVLEVFKKLNGKSIDLDNPEESKSLLQKYLAENFILQNKAGEKLDLKWVGMETDFDRTFVYLEVPSDESIEEFELSNTIFFETYPKQTNIVIAGFDDKKADLFFKAKDGFKKIRKNKK